MGEATLTVGKSHGRAFALTPDSHNASKTQFVYGALLVTGLLQVPGFRSVPVAAFLTLLFLPVLWSKAGKRARFALSVLLCLVVACLINGALLSLAITPGFGMPGSDRAKFELTIWISGLALSAGGIVCAMEHVSVKRVLLLLSVGGLVTGVLTINPTLNLWKFSLGFALIFALLAIASHLKISWSRAVLILGFGLSVAFDYRSLALICLVCLVASLFQNFLSRAALKQPVLTIVVAGLVGVLATAGLYQGLVGGVFGQELQSRTTQQTAKGQNPILGARTEWGATLQLAATKPMGFGIASLVDPGLQTDALAAAGSIGADSSGSYYRTNVFSDRVDLHSSFADLWFHFGLGGLVSALAAALALLRGLGLASVTLQRWQPAMLFLVLNGLWNLFFSPMGNAAIFAAGVALAIGLSIRRQVD